MEDDPFTARRLHRVLVSRGLCQIVHATTVAEALRLLEPLPDWVILDMHLPDGLGLVVLQAIREAGLPVHVIVSSAMKDSHLLAALAVYKPDLVIPKPLNPAHLPTGLGVIRSASARQADHRRHDDRPQGDDIPPTDRQAASRLPEAETPA